MTNDLIVKNQSLALPLPTGNLDHQSGQDVIHILEELNERGITLIMVTHDPNIAARARETIRLVDGLILPNGQRVAA